MDITLSFFLKKGISFLLMPLTISLIFALLAFFYIRKENIKMAKRYLLIMIVWTLLITSAPISNLLLVPLESQYKKLEKVPPNIEYVLLLGGDKERRAWEAVRLYQLKPEMKIITSGYSLYDRVSEAEKLAKMLKESGVNTEHILMQSKAKDTKEEAIELKKRIGSAPFILVTSAYHMPRAMQIFKRAGVNPIAAPADFNNSNEDGFFSALTGKKLRKTEKALHEYLGLLWLKLKK